MTFDFDEIIEQRGMRSGKWDGMESALGVSPEDGIPMFVADMDFRAPPAVTTAMRDLLDCGVLGYPYLDADFSAAVVDWVQARHGWEVDPRWILPTHGVVSGIGLTLQALTDAGDGVVVFSPVYHAFYRIIQANRRQVIESPLEVVDGRHRMNLDRLAQTLPDNARIVLLCSPHNPGGRVWSADEIRALAEFCEQRNLWLISDEIHMDLVYPEATHTPTQMAAPGIMPRLITTIAATKTFNIAGALTGALVIPEASVRAKVRNAGAAAGVSHLHRFGAVAVIAAYRGGAEWLDALIPYLSGNRDRLDAALRAIPGVRTTRMEATYLAWADFAGTNLPAEEVSRRLRKEARVAPSPGKVFGQGGETCQRFNFALPQPLLDEAIGRITAAFSDLK